MIETEPRRRARRLLAVLGAAMVGTGQPVHEVEEELRLVALRMNWPEAQIAAQPTGLTVSLRPGDPATFQNVATALGLDQADEVRVLLHRLLARRLSPAGALRELDELAARPPRYPTWLVGLGWVGFSVGIGLILQPDPVSLAVNAVCAVLVWILVRVSQRIAFVRKVLPTLAAFVVACLVFTADHYQLLDAPLRTILAPLAILLPGSALVIGISELAAGAMVAGVSRIGYGVVRLLLFAAGIVAAVALFQVPPQELNDVRVNTLGWWSAPIGLLLIGVGVSFMQGARERLMLWITLNVAVSFLVQTLGQQLGGALLGGFLGAGAATLGAALVEMIRPKLPRMVVFLPAFYLLVPGSLGLLSVTQLAVDADGLAATGFAIAQQVTAIALGLLFGAAAAQSIRATWRRARQLL